MNNINLSKYLIGLLIIIFYIHISTATLISLILFLFYLPLSGKESNARKYYEEVKLNDIKIVDHL